MLPAARRRPIATAGKSMLWNISSAALRMLNVLLLDQDRLGTCPAPPIWVPLILKYKEALTGFCLVIAHPVALEPAALKQG